MLIELTISSRCVRPNHHANLRRVRCRSVCDCLATACTATVSHYVFRMELGRCYLSGLFLKCEKKLRQKVPNYNRIL